MNGGVDMKKINWGILGTAGIAKGEVIPGMLLAESAHPYAIAGRKPEKVAEFKEMFNFEKAYIGYDALLEDEKVEAVYIPLSNDLHKEWIIKAARKKKHILCEKPLVASAEDLKEVFEVCRAEGVFLMEAFAYLHSPIINDLAQQLKEGVIGKVRLIETTFFIPKQEEDNIRSRKETLGGSQYDLGCYNISLILKLLGEMPQKISAMSRFADSGIDLYTHAQLLFSDGVTATSSCGMILENTLADRVDRCFIQGETGHIEVFVPYNEKGELSYRIVKSDETMDFSMDVPNNYMLEIEQFGNVVKKIETPLVSEQFSCSVAKIQDEILTQIGYWQE